MGDQTSCVQRTCAPNQRCPGTKLCKTSSSVPRHPSFRFSSARRLSNACEKAGSFPTRTSWRLKRSFQALLLGSMANLRKTPRKMARAHFQHPRSPSRSFRRPGTTEGTTGLIRSGRLWLFQEALVGGSRVDGLIAFKKLGSSLSSIPKKLFLVLASKPSNLRNESFLRLAQQQLAESLQTCLKKRI